MKTFGQSTELPKNVRHNVQFHIKRNFEEIAASPTYRKSNNPRNCILSKSKRFPAISSHSVCIKLVKTPLQNLVPDITGDRDAEDDVLGGCNIQSSFCGCVSAPAVAVREDRRKSSPHRHLQEKAGVVSRVPYVPHCRVFRRLRHHVVPGTKSEVRRTLPLACSVFDCDGRRCIDDVSAVAFVADGNSSIVAAYTDYRVINDVIYRLLIVLVAVVSFTDKGESFSAANALRRPDAAGFGLLRAPAQICPADSQTHIPYLRDPSLGTKHCSTMRICSLK
nr:hypothetical protein Iba_chr08eCG8960 [Ipomoea batatas]